LLLTSKDKKGRDKDKA